jgi:RTX calcium-binding nonapeptide repeat (4 copies)/WD40-like Beta Propeller Repeat
MRTIRFITPAPCRRSVLKSAFVSLAGLLAFLIPAMGVSSTAALPGRNGTILASSGRRLYSVTADGRRLDAIGRIRVVRPWDPAQASWSPDGTTIAFARPGGGISLSDAAGKHVRRITSRGEAPAWSPDGSRIALTRGNWVYVMRRDGHGLERLFRGRGAQWSPDGTRLAFEVREQDLTNIYVSALDGTARTRITNAWSGDCTPYYPGQISYGEPTWSRDGTRLAFTEWYSCGSNLYTTIYASSAVGSDWEPLVEPGTPDSGGSAPVWSPDGSALAYYYDDGVEWGGLSILHFGGRDRAVRKNLVPFDWRPVCRLRGGSRGDRLRGDAGGQLICGLGGGDTITGGAGSDRLFGEDGNDRFFARDGEFDVVGCGAGRDKVVADELDLIGLDCESVNRS